MGNSYPASKSLDFFIETEKPYYNSGSSIEGTVFVNAKKNFKFDALYIRIEGTEWCEWFEGSSKNRRKYYGSDNFYIVEHKIYNYEDELLQMGHYAHPFSLELSDNIPGSYESRRQHAKIEYKLIAYFVNYKEQKLSQFCELPITIKEPFRQDIVRYSGEATTKPKTLGFFEKGEVELKVDFDRNVAYEEQEIVIEIEADNGQGTVDIPGFKIELVEYTFVSSNGNASRTYRQPIQKIPLKEKVPKGEARKIEYIFKIPKVVHQTAISTLVANYFRIEVSTDLGLISTDNPSIYAPIFILHRMEADQKEQPSKTDPNKFEFFKPICIRSGEYLFKKNRNLDVYNFRKEDLVSNSHLTTSEYLMAT